MGKPLLEDDWDVLFKFLPKDLEENAKKLGALVRKREIKSASVLLRVLFIHLADSKSLRTTCAIAKETNLCQVSDTSLLHRLEVSGNWLRWIALELLEKLNALPASKDCPQLKYKVKLIDASTVSEPGSTGSDWRLHYSLLWPSILCDTFKITDIKTGESFQRFKVKRGDLFVADRAYCTVKGVTYVKDNEGEVLVRFHSTNLPMRNRQGKLIFVLDYLRQLKDTESGDWDVWYQSKDGRLIKGRLCAIRKSIASIEKAKKKLRQEALRKKKKLSPETLEYAEYVILFTSVYRSGISKNNVFSLYRGRWQIELIFKRLKGIIGLGHLPKFKESSCEAWLYGKLVVALLIETLYREAEFFSPWGYPSGTQVISKQ